jgi:type IX secretion system PorP/SprF family membrane protein
MSINPAYAGSRDVLSFTGLYRTQWVGLEGAPKTQTFNVHSPIGKSEKVGLGLSVIHDEIGPTQETYIDIDFSYKINTSELGQLFFGIKGGGHLLNIDYTKLNIYNPSDALLGTNIENKFSPNIGAGIYYRHNDKFYVGLSVPNILETKHFGNNDSQQSSIAKEQMNFYFISGYVFDLNKNLKFKPAVLLKGISGAPLQADLTASFLLNEKLTLGAAYRWSAAISAMVGLQVSDGIMLGFAYDRETTELGSTTFNDGSYEVFLRFELQQLGKILSPRFF